MSHPERKVSLDTHLFVGFSIGVALAVIFRSSPEWVSLRALSVNILYPIGMLFLRVFFLCFAPFLFFTVALTIGTMRSFENGMRMSLCLGRYYIATTVIAIAIGQAIVTWVKPGLAIPADFLEGVQGPVGIALAQPIDGLDDFLRPYLNIPLFSSLANGKMILVLAGGILAGIVLNILPARKASSAIFLVRTCKRLSAFPMEQIMRLAPAGIALLTLGAFCKLNLAIHSGLLQFAGVVGLALGLHEFVVYPLILHFVIGYNPIEFFKNARPAILSAFFSTSGNVVLPVTLRTLQTRFKVPESIASFSVPLGANFNLDGTALFEAVTVVFLAQAYRMDFTLGHHIFLLGLVLVTSVGMPGVPGTGMPFLATCLATFNIPLDGIGLIMGLDAVFKMLRSAVNTTGDLTAALYLTRSENALQKPQSQPRPVSAHIRRISPLSSESLS